MPTKKPRVQTILNEDIYEKFKTLCDKEMRTESQMASFIITKFITFATQDMTHIILCLFGIILVITLFLGLFTLIKNFIYNHIH